jgi:hypothetical protein
MSNEWNSRSRSTGITRHAFSARMELCAKFQSLIKPACFFGRRRRSYETSCRIIKFLLFDQTGSPAAGGCAV